MKKTVSFSVKEKDLLNHVISKGEFSSIVKQLIRADMKVIEIDNLSQSVNELIEVIVGLKTEVQDLKLEIKYMQQHAKIEPLIPPAAQTSISLSELDDL